LPEKQDFMPEIRQFMLKFMILCLKKHDFMPEIRQFMPEKA
jgi:hypothetical protein